MHPGWMMKNDVSGYVVLSTESDVRFAAVSQVLKTAGYLDRAASDLLSELGITAGAFNALLEIERHGEDGIAPSELARSLAVARRTATLYVDVLTQNGWASRRPHPDDRRMVLASLTPDGRSLLDRVGETYRQRLADLLGSMGSDDANQLRLLLAMIPLKERTAAD